jgi:basic membrane protein A
MKKLVLLAIAALALGAAPAHAEFKVGLVLDKGGKDDKSFNASAYRGAMQAKDQLKLSVKYVEATDDNSIEPFLRSFAQKNFDLIIGVGISMGEAVKKVAAQFPKQHFAVVDAQVDAPNVRSLLFEEHEGSYLVGAIAAMTSKTGKLGFIGGMDIPLIRRFEMGYAAGAKKINPKVEIKANYVGVTLDAWNNPPKAKELALAQYSGGVDVIFAAAGASGNGLFDAAEEKKKFAIGVDSNQNWVKPGQILTSMLKRVDIAVLMTCMDAAGGSFTGGVKRYGLANQGVDYSVDEYNDKLLSKDVRAKVEALKADIVAGKIHVPDYYKKK